MERGGVSSMAVTVRRVGGRTRSEGEKGDEAQKLDHEFGEEGGKVNGGGRGGTQSWGRGEQLRRGETQIAGGKWRQEGGT